MSTRRPRSGRALTRQPTKPARPDEPLVQRTKALIEGMTGIGRHAYFVWDFKKDCMLAGGAHLAELYGYTLQEIEKMPGKWMALIHPDDVPIAIAMTQRILNAKSKTTIITEQLRIRCSNGQWEVIHITQRVLDRDENGAVLSWVGSSEIITSYVASFDELKRREAMYRQMVEHAADGIFLCDARGSILSANPFTERMLGYKKGGLRGMSLRRVFDLPRKGWQPDDFTRLRKNAKLRTSCDANRRNGKLLAVDLRIRKLADDRILGIARDMSREMERAEEERRQAGYYRGLFRNNNSGVCLFDDSLRISTVNDALKTLLKYSEKQLLGKHLIDYVVPEQQDEAKKVFYQMQHDRRFNTLYRNGVKLTLLRKDGSRVQVQTALTSIGDGVVLFTQGIAIFTDITEEHRYRQERDEQAHFNEALLRDAPVCIMVADPTGKILQVNPALEKLTGYKQRDLVGKNGWESGLMDPDQQPGSIARYQALMAGAPAVNSTLRLFTKRGGIKIVESQATLTRKPNGDPLCIILTGMDVTEQKRLEAEVIKVAEQEQMRIGNDLHDGVGQTLTGTISLMEVLESQLDGEALKDAVRIRNLLRDAIQQVRSLSHGLSPAAVKHRGLASSLRLLCDNTTHARLTCKLFCDWEPKFKNPEAETHLFRVAQEAVSNAIRHGKPKNITIFLRKDSQARGLMEIHDDGNGIDSRKLSKSEGIGIRVMRYRLGLLGGKFEIRPGDYGGTVVFCHFSCAI